jgi:hypothetical protein
MARTPPRGARGSFIVGISRARIRTWGLMHLRRIADLARRAECRKPVDAGRAGIQRGRNRTGCPFPPGAGLAALPIIHGALDRLTAGWRDRCLAGGAIYNCTTAHEGRTRGGTRWKRCGTGRAQPAGTASTHTDQEGSGGAVRLERGNNVGNGSSVHFARSVAALALAARARPLRG